MSHIYVGRWNIPKRSECHNFLLDYSNILCTSAYFLPTSSAPHAANEILNRITTCKSFFLCLMYMTKKASRIKNHRPILESVYCEKVTSHSTVFILKEREDLSIHSDRSV